MDSFVNLIQKLALIQYLGDGLKTHDPQADEEQCDQEKTRKQFCMDRGPNRRNPPDDLA
jgi:hypothetical protein